LPVAVAGPAVERIYPHHHSLIERFKRFDYKRNRIRIVIGAVSFVGLIGLMSSPNKNVKKVGEMSSPSIDTAIPFDKLSPENKSAVKDTFNLARNLYVTGKYELCLEELKKLHNLVPFYENSKELVNLCTQGSDFAKIKADLDYKQQEKMRREREIQAITESCQDKLSKNPSLPEDDLQSCLAPAIELDPENAKVVELTTLLKVRQEERQEKQRQSQVYRERVQKTEALYSIAKQKLKSGKLRDAVDEYDRILNSSLPDVNGIKSKAQRELSSVRKQLEEKVGHLLAVCQDNLEKTHFRAAYNACFEATQEDPKNQTAQVTLQRSLSELRREMKAVYEDSVLEESLGNIDAAKEKWKRLMQEDLPTDDYSIKSKLKLQKYGIGL
jgi:tetratricopeptide (TPR) repeat protein